MRSKTGYPQLFLVVLLVVVSASACGEATAGSTAVTPTYAPCSPQNVVGEIGPLNALMREFDDAAQLAAVVQVDQLVSVIPSLQAVRRRVEDLQVPDCLSDLKGIELQEMNAFINTLLVFVQVRDTQSQVVAEGLAQAQSLHNQYNLELARLLGVTLSAPEPTGLPSSATITP